jgi:protein O-GlcNAc transferase
MAGMLGDKLREAFGRLSAGDAAGAGRLCDEVLKQSPGNADALHLLGVVRLMTGNVGDAVLLLGKAATAKPDDPAVHFCLGNALAESGQTEQAIVCYRRAVALESRHVDAHFNLGTLLMRGGQLDAAAAAFRSALIQAPDYADAHTNLGLVYAEQGRLDEAIASYRRALELAPAQFQAHNNLGNTLLSQNRIDDAAACFEKAQAIQPDHPDAYVNLGNLRAKQGDFAAAQALYDSALSLAPRSADVLLNLGRLQRMQGRPNEAFKLFRRALEIDPKRADTHADMAISYRDAGVFADAEIHFKRAIEIDGKQPGYFHNLAELLKVQNRFDEVAALNERALEIKADYLPALGALIHARQHMCAWDGIEKLWERSRREAVGEKGAGISPFSIMSQPSSPQEQLACAQSWAEQELAPMAAERVRLGFDHAKRRGLPDKIRIGYLSWDYHQHATSYLIAELFELHDRGKFAVFAYSFGPDDGSAIRARIRGACDCFADVAQQSHVAIAQTIYDDGVDILVDLKGYTQGSRPQIIALRPAPVQVNWLGFPGTMGTDCIDYIIADPFVIPEGMDRFYSEKIVRLPDCYQVNDRQREIASQTPGRAECELPTKGVVFCCFNQTAKILPDVFASWMRILKAVPDSVLWLLDANRFATENLQRAVANHGVAAGRLIFAPRVPMPDHLARYRLADLALDTFPYTSHTTASDALWTGCPLVTCAGETFASRVAGSILIAAGLPELVTQSLADCERLVVNLATNPEKLRDLRRKLMENRDHCALFDTPRFVRDLEHAYAEMRKP